jgi:ATP-dependent exoDNAse (exonuclease V) alpha subunit
VLSHAQRSGAKVVLVGDPEQLQAIEAGAAFRSIAERHGAAEITEVRRQREDWQRDATRALATGSTGEAIRLCRARHGPRGRHARGGAGELVDGWDRQRQADPDKTRIILTHTNAEVRELNQEARDRLRAPASWARTCVRGRAGRARLRGRRPLMFLRNERSLGVKNGTLGTIERFARSMAVRLDGGREVRSTSRIMPMSITAMPRPSTNRRA